MTDLAYDIATMEITVKDRDFAFNSNVSEQNGALFLYTKNANVYFPMAGVGIGAQTINSGVTEMALQLNRWQAQVKQDGAKSAGWNTSKDADGNLIFETNCDYE